MEKRCSKCGEEFPATTEFWHRDKGRRDGLNPYCKPCTREADRKSKRRLVTDTTTGETLRAGALSKRRLVTDPTTGETLTVSALSKRKRYQNGKWHEYMESNPLAKMRAGLSNLVRMSMRGRGFSKQTKTAKLLGCDFEFFQLYIEEQFTEGMSWANAGEWHFDHILPCSCATTETELLALQHFSNFQPMWGSANLSKGTSLPADWEERKQKLMEIYYGEMREAA